MVARPATVGQNQPLGASGKLRPPADLRRRVRTGPKTAVETRLNHMKPLIVPPAAQRDEKSIQMLSAWIAENGLHCSLKIGMWQENGRSEAPAWGILLADTIRHIANALQESYGQAAPDTIASILESLQNELDAPTSATKGDFSPGHS